MIGKLFNTMFLSVVVVNLCTAHTNYPAITNWFKLDADPFKGVHLTIFLTNTDMVIGSQCSCQCRAYNGSTNNIALYEANYWSATDVFLTNRVGKVYQLTPKYLPGGPIYAGFCQPLKVGKTFEWTVPLTLSTNIEPGEYQLFARQVVMTSDWKMTWKITSNLYKVKVVRKWRFWW